MYYSAVDSIYIIIMVLMLSTDLSEIVIWLCCEDGVEGACVHTCTHMHAHALLVELVKKLNPYLP